MVEERAVGFVADRADHRRAARGHRPQQRLVGERQQVLDAAAAAGDDDDLDVLGGVEVGQQRQDARYRRRTLHGGVADLEAHRRPAGGGHGHHVALRGTGPARDQADRLRQERQWLLESRIEQSLGGEQLPQPFDAGEQFADPDGPDVGDPQRQRGPAGVERGTPQHHYATALGQRHRRPVKQVRIARDLHGHVSGRITQRDERDPAAGSPADLGDLALDPDLPQLVHPVGDLGVDRPDRPRIVRCVGGALVAARGGVNPAGHVVECRFCCAVTRFSIIVMNGTRALVARS